MAAHRAWRAKPESWPERCSACETRALFARLTGVKLLIVNGREAWVHQLGVIGAELHLVDALPGRVAHPWDRHLRPFPAGARRVSLDEVRFGGGSYDGIVAHRMSDLIETRHVDAPRLLVLHDTLDGWMARERSRVQPREMRAMVNSALVSVGGHAVAVSRAKARSWGVTHMVLQDSVATGDYLPHVGDVACGVRVASHIAERRDALAWGFQEAAMAGLPLRIVGENPGMGNAAPADDWPHVKRILASHRFAVHTADPRMEDGHDPALLEAMAAGLPVLANRHPTTIVEHGVTGFVAETPAEMRAHAERLLADEGLARRLGENARSYVARHHAPERFRAEFTQAVQESRKKWARRRGTVAR